MLGKLGGTAMTITVYHGGTEAIGTPLCHIGRDNLDFGKGFYLTDIREQAVRWAMNTARRRGKAAILNRYRLDKNAILKTAKCKIFTAYNAEWLDFVVASRQGLYPAAGFDYIEGGVANDRVVDTVNLYMAGLMDAETALKRLACHQPSNQICLLSQTITDLYLVYDGTEPAK